MKKLLLLGGSSQQIPAIKCANNLGYYTILCDYLPDNPGQSFADEFYCISTTDKQGILKISQEKNIDGILAYASDPAAPTASYVADCLNLPSNPQKSVEILAYKDKFREFLQKNNFNCPTADKYQSYSELEKNITKFKFPIVVKPIDSSGSKGVVKVEGTDFLENSFNNALKYSNSKTVIVEEFIAKNHDYMLGGDCFVLNGKVEFWGLLNCHRDNNVNNLVPIGKSYPLQISSKNMKHLKDEVQRIVDLLDIRFGGFNLEIIFDKNDDLYFIEIGPRNGGNMIPDFLKMITGVNLVEASVKSAMGDKEIDLNVSTTSGFYATHNIHSAIDGIFKKIRFDESLKKKIIDKKIYVKEDDVVHYFDSASKALGIIFMKFDSKEELYYYTERINSLIKIDLK